MRSWLVYIVLFLGCGSLFAQQQERSNNYFLLPATLNPAYATDVDRPELFLHYAQYLTGVPGAPSTQGLQFYLPFRKDTMGFGVGVFHEQLNVLETLKASAMYGYEKSFGAKQSVQLGVTLQAINQRLDFDKIRSENPEESSLLQNSSRALSMNMGLGIAYSYSDLSIGVVADQLRESNVLFSSPEDDKSLNFQYIRHFLFHASYKKKLKKLPLVVQPLVLLRSTQGVPVNWEVGTSIAYDEKFWLSLAYWHNTGVKTGIGVNVLSQLSVGYQYGFPTTEIAKISSGSHEVVMKFSMNRKDNSTIDTTKFDVLPTAKDVVDSTEIQAKHRNEEIWEELQRFEKEEHDERLKYLNLIEKEKEEIAQLQMDLREMQEEFELDITELEHDVDSLAKAPHGVASPEAVEAERDKPKSQTLPSKNPVAKRKMKVVGYYVVVGEFKYEENADRYVAFFESTYKSNSAYKAPVQTTSGKIYYVAHSLETTSYEEAKREVVRINKLDTQKIVDGGAWICKKREYSW